MDFEDKEKISYKVFEQEVFAQKTYLSVVWLSSVDTFYYTFDDILVENNKCSFLQNNQSSKGNKSEQKRSS